MTSATDDRAVPAHARELAARLSELFDRDVEIVKQLNDAHHRLAHANEQLYTGRVLDTPQQIHWQIHHAFSTYQAAAEQRRQLAVDVGEISQQFTTRSAPPATPHSKPDKRTCTSSPNQHPRESPAAAGPAATRPRA